MLTGMRFSGYGLAGSELAGLIVAVSFAAGLNVYATVATLGLLAHAGLLALPSGLHLLIQLVGHRGLGHAVCG